MKPNIFKVVVIGESTFFPIIARLAKAPLLSDTSTISLTKIPHPPRMPAA